MEQNYDVIATIIDADQHDIIIDACEKSGAKIYTAFHATSTVGKKSFKLLSVIVEPTKEIILIIVPRSKSKEILSKIVSYANLNDPENGFAFSFEIKDLGGFTSLLKASEFE